MNRRLRNNVIAVSVTLMFVASLPHGRDVVINLINGGWRGVWTGIEGVSQDVGASVRRAGSDLIQGNARKNDWNAVSDWVAKIAPGSRYGRVFPAKVVRVLDGDTMDVNVNGKTYRIRLADVDTFEIHDNRKMAEDVRRFGVGSAVLKRAGLAAKSYVERRIASHSVGVSFPGDSPVRDAYGRLVAYIHLDNGEVLNEALVSNGYAKAWGGISSWNRAIYTAMEKRAKLGHVGVWGLIADNRR